MAEITLRKAGQIRGTVEKRIRELEPGTVSRLELNIYDPDPLATVAEYREAALERVRLVDRLDRVLTRLRAAIGRANVESGVDALLATRAGLERRAARLQRLTRGREPVRPDTLVRQLEGRREKGGDDERGGLWAPRTSGDTLATESLTQEELDRLGEDLARVRRELADANDALLHLNLESTIVVADEDAEWLRSEKVI